METIKTFCAHCAQGIGAHAPGDASYNAGRVCQRRQSELVLVSELPQGMTWAAWVEQATGGVVTGDHRLGVHEDMIRIGQTWHAFTHSDLATGKIESGHAGQWMIRTASGELTGPWDTEDLHHVLYVATINVPGYLPMADEPTVFETPRAAWKWLIEERNRSWNEDDDEQGPDYDGTMATMDNMVGCGRIHGSTPGYDGDHDLGLAYSVNVYQGD